MYRCPTRQPMRPPITVLTPCFAPGELHPAFFMDRDDTLIFDVPYLNDPDKVRLIPGAVEGLRTLRRCGWRLIVVSNQSGIGRGRFTEDELLAVNQRVTALLAQDGVCLDAIYCCPHTPDCGCTCRKPKCGLIALACTDFCTDRSRSAMAGDKAGDIAAGKAAGITAIQICSLGQSADFGADFRTADLAGAAEWLLRKHNAI